MTDDTTLTPPESPEAREARGHRLAEALGGITRQDASESTEPSPPAGDPREGPSGRERGGQDRAGTHADGTRSPEILAAVFAAIRSRAPEVTGTRMLYLALDIIDAAAPFIRAEARDGSPGTAERDLILGDLGDLLEALGLGDYARPVSPHEVMRQCIDEAAKLRNGGRHLGSTVEHQARALYAAWIDAAQHRDLSGAVAGLEEQLDGFEGPAWDGAESGLQWLERTRPAPADGLRPEDQPLPVPNDGASMHDLVIGDLMDGHPGARTLAGVVADLRDRKLLGLRRYGSLLQAFNGRDALRDLHEELEDAAVYARQCLTEAQSGDEALRMLRTVYGSLLQALLAVRAVMDRQEPGSEP
jgi:hypothetical protein